MYNFNFAVVSVFSSDPAMLVKIAIHPPSQKNKQINGTLQVYVQAAILTDSSSIYKKN